MKGCQCVGGILSIGLACMNAHLGLACRYIAATRKLYGKDDPTPFDMYQVDMLADGMCCTPSVCVRECVRVCVCVCVCVSVLCLLCVSVLCPCINKILNF